MHYNPHFPKFIEKGSYSMQNTAHSACKITLSGRVRSFTYNHEIIFHISSHMSIRMMNMTDDGFHQSVLQ